MKPYLVALVALAPLGCALSTDSTVYDVRAAAYDAGQSSSSDPNATSGDGMDATTCVVQGKASVTGVSFAARDAIEVFDATKGKFTFLITDYAGACSMINGGHAGSNVVSIEYDDTALSSGTYDVTKTAGLSVSYVQYDAACRASKTQTAESGSVVFDRLDDCGGEGSVDLVFGSAHVTATFTASVCAVPSGASSCH